MIGERESEVVDLGPYSSHGAVSITMNYKARVSQ